MHHLNYTTPFYEVRRRDLAFLVYDIIRVHNISYIIFNIISYDIIIFIYKNNKKVSYRNYHEYHIYDM